MFLFSYIVRLGFELEKRIFLFLFDFTVLVVFIFVVLIATVVILFDSLLF